MKKVFAVQLKESLRNLTQKKLLRKPNSYSNYKKYNPIVDANPQISKKKNAFLRKGIIVKNCVNQIDDRNLKDTLQLLLGKYHHLLPVCIKFKGFFVETSFTI